MAARVLSRLTAIAPGLAPLASYSFARDFQHDALAGLSVAAVALPVAVAYAQLAGFDPVVGLYSSILPLVAYAVFGTSRHLMVNPDAATCAMIAAAIVPMAGGDNALYLSLSITLTFLTGIVCIAASFFRLGVLADFLSKPILVGFLNGIAISIFLGQIGKLLGFSVEAGGVVPRLFEIFHKLPQTHLLTLSVALCCALLMLMLRYLPRLPAALIVLVAAGGAAALFGLNARGVAILGPVAPGLPHLRWPAFPPQNLASLVADAAGLALVLFTSGTLTARSFASKGGYDIDIDRELAGYGVANIASALSQGFAVTGADSRTAMAAAAGGRTQVTGLIAAATIALVLLFLTDPLQYVPIAALGTVLIFAAFSLFDIKTLKDLWGFDRAEFALALITMLGVISVGAIDGVLVAVALALARFVRQTARPRTEILGTLPDLPGFHSVERHPTAETLPGLTIFRFNAPLTFFNADYFKQCALAAADAAGPSLQWLVIDAIPISRVDISGLYVLRELLATLERRGITLVLAGRKTEILHWLDGLGLPSEQHQDHVFPTLRQALKAYQRQSRPTAASQNADVKSNP
ncbi:MAG TPA: SulP family inorganic anion transporter [Xanthobacteraceae bacterium]|jgi:high affinity sulfate transporter 1|nr:SulP family inorganic anion transporter [Xanthobacteraceae bacterium]